LVPEGIEMYIDRANEITVATKATGAARPVSVFGLVLCPRASASATGSSFGGGHARGAGLPEFVREVVDISAVLPQGHALNVLPAGAPKED